jgi:hypothetical protein
VAIDTLRQGQPALAPFLRKWQETAATVVTRFEAVTRTYGLVLGFVAYVVAVVGVTSQHEPWFDEAQAWLLARDDSLWHMLTAQMRYEGSPALWHLLLMGPAKLGLPYFSLQVIAVAIAVMGALVLARYSPFPWPLTVAALFSFVIGYQYAVVARSYVLIPLLLFLLAIAWNRRFARPWRFVLVLCLLANVSVHGLLIAGSVFAVHLFELWRPPPNVRDVPSTRQTRFLHLRVGAVFIVVCGLIVAQLWPAPDQSFGTAFNPNPIILFTFGSGVINSALTGNPWASLCAIAVSAWWFRQTRTLLLWALPTFALIALSAMKYFNYWHDGIPFLVWLFALWVSIERGPVDQNRSTHWLRLGVFTAMAGVLLVQGVWWWQSANFDLAKPYSGSKALVAWLAQQDLDNAKIDAVGYHALSTLPYFSNNIYDNNNGGNRPAYMTWSTRSRLHDNVWSVWMDRPDTIIWAVKTWKPLRQPGLPGYKRTAVFEGQMYWKNRAIERDAFYVFTRDTQR